MSSPEFPVWPGSQVGIFLPVVLVSGVRSCGYMWLGHDRDGIDIPVLRI